MTAVLQLFRNISSNYLKVGINGLVLILLTPYLVSELGPALYAVWIIMLTLGYYLEFFDLGISDAQVQRHSVLASQGATSELGRLHGTVLTLFAGAGLAACLISILLVMLPTADLFDIPADARATYQLVVPLIGLSVLFSFAELAINGIFEGYQRYDVMNAIDIVLTVIDAVAMAGVLYLGYGLIGLALVKVTLAAIGAAVKAITAFRLFPAYARPTPGFDRSIWHSIRGFSLWNSLNDLLTEGTANFDKLLIPILLGSALLTPYSLVVTIAAAVLMVAEPITETFFPIAARRHGRKDAIGLGVLLTRGSKIVSMATVPTLVVVLCFGQTILGVWIDEELTDVNASVLWFMALTFYFSTFLWPSLSVLTGSGHVKTLFWGSLVEVILSIALIVTLAPRYGLPGFAFAGLVANVVIGSLFFMLRACRLTGIPVWPFVLKTLLLPLLASIPSLALGLWLLQTMRPAGWVDTGLCAALTGLFCAASIFFVLTTRWERLRYRATLRRLLGAGESL